MAEVIGIPRIMTGDKETPRVVLKSHVGAVYMPGPKIIHGSGSRDLGNTDATTVLRAGMLMGMNSTTKKWVPAYLGYMSGALASGAGAIHVPSAVRTEITRRVGASGNLVLIGPSGTVAYGSLDYDRTIHYTKISGIHLVLSGTLPRAFVTLSLFGVDDGSWEPKAIIPDGTGVKVTSGEITTNNVDVQFTRPLVGGMMDASQLITHQGATTEWCGGNTQLKEYVKNKLRTYCAGIMFDSDYE